MAHVRCASPSPPSYFLQALWIAWRKLCGSPWGASHRKQLDIPCSDIVIIGIYYITRQEPTGQLLWGKKRRRHVPVNSIQLPATRNVSPGIDRNNQVTILIHGFFISFISNGKFKMTSRLSITLSLTSDVMTQTEKWKILYLCFDFLKKVIKQKHAVLCHVYIQNCLGSRKYSYVIRSHAWFTTAFIGALMFSTQDCKATFSF